ncbi:MAG TPA: antitoxin VapB family protein [archaeon]|nr:antitoxin VapB family protein [archaeon]
MTKVISVSDEAYERLSRIKGRDSFTGTIMRLTKPRKKNLLDVVKSWEPDEELARNIEEAGRRLRKAKLRRFDL